MSDQERQENPVTYYTGMGLALAVAAGRMGLCDPPGLVNPVHKPFRP